MGIVFFIGTDIIIKVFIHMVLGGYFLHICTDIIMLIIILFTWSLRVIFCICAEIIVIKVFIHGVLVDYFLHMYIYIITIIKVFIHGVLGCRDYLLQKYIVIIIIKVFIKCKILSLETTLSAARRARAQRERLEAEEDSRTGRGKNGRSVVLERKCLED